MERDPAAAVTRKANLLQLEAGNFRPGFVAPAAASFKLDEGYSDETRSQAENEASQPASEDVLTMPEWVLTHTETERAELAYTILRTLRTSTVAGIVEKLTPLLHMDPVQKLPPEITAEIFSYLDPPTLLEASLASRAWRDRIQDSRLWRQLYINEGWGLDLDEVHTFEQQSSKQEPPQSTRKLKTRHADSDVGQPKLKRRVPSTWFSSQRAESNNSNVNMLNPPWNEQHDPVEADSTTPPSPDAEGDQEMQDAASEDHRTIRSSFTQSLSPTSCQSSLTDRATTSLSPSSPSAAQLRFKSSVVHRFPNGAAKINWPYLYKQRRRLEENWINGRYTNFQLPHPNYPQEAHQECVYAIQFSGKWLVSGSRDKTLRVWDLETKRLRGSPLIGHTKSVLCLQFDPSEKEDIIVSGSSDKDVLIWRFSTGELLHKLVDAHQDSVLNLRFDERFLVTCSKDKLIKVWNRRTLTAADKDYPSVIRGPGVNYPAYIVDTKSMPSPVLEAEIANQTIKTLEPFSLLMSLDGHGAAVNAIQIDEDEIVSASGDRLIKVWNIHSGACLKTLMGHQKGIACVQFDSRRIVSGSNDDTVRIYDHASGAEVACLQGHHNLVRTVQAGFGDPPGADEALRLEAMAVDSDYWDARRNGTVPESSLVHSRRNRRVPRNAGSRNPKDVTALGAKIPPGGGGSSWGRIVSGSYDETIIIWKKERDGNWVIGQRLRQADAALAASLAHGRRQPQPAQPAPTINHQHQQTGASPAAPRVPSQATPQGGQTPAAGVPANWQQAAGGGHQPPAPHLPGFPMLPTQALAALQNGQPVPVTAASNAPVGHHHHRAHIHRPFHNAPPTSRVFKLQFDARKIICASQDPRIVGWDFTCGDEELEESCRFFKGL